MRRLRKCTKGIEVEDVDEMDMVENVYETMVEEVGKVEEVKEVREGGVDERKDHQLQDVEEGVPVAHDSMISTVTSVSTSNVSP